MNKVQGGTKLIEIRLQGFVRVEHTEVVEVPANITQAELEALVNDRCNKVDPGDYVDDPEYWKCGECEATDAEPQAKASLVAFRLEGGMHVERAEAQSAPDEAFNDWLQAVAGCLGVDQVDGEAYRELFAAGLAPADAVLKERMRAGVLEG